MNNIKILTAREKLQLYSLANKMNGYEIIPETIHEFNSLSSEHFQEEGEDENRYKIDCLRNRRNHGWVAFVKKIKG